MSDPIVADISDIDTLGGAGFASQRYRFGPRPLSLPPLQYRGITLKVQPDRPSISSSKPHRAEIFTLVLKTTLPTSPPSKPKNPPSPEPASLSYEISFTPSSALSTQRFDLDFDDFKAVYRGREVKRDDPRYQPLHTEEIYELSFMCRSDFAAQKGDFSVIVHSLEGWKKDKVAKGERGGLVGVLSAIWVGLVAWVWSFFSGTEGRIALHDEEKDPLI